MGFFQGVSLPASKAPPIRVAQCGICKLYQSCHTPKMPVFGKGRRQILVVGEAPGKNEDEQGRPFVGESGSILTRTLVTIDPEFELDFDTWRTNALICRPPKNRKPTDKEIDYCRPNLTRTIQELRPRAILLLGDSAVRSVIGHIWKESPGAISRWVGYAIPYQRWNCWILPAYHPAYLARDAKNVGLRLWFQRHLQNVLEIDNRPQDVMTDLSKQPIQRLYDRDEIEQAIAKIIRWGKPVAFDYETNMVKPDSSAAEIVSCSICVGGKHTIAFPWIYELHDTLRDFVQSDLPKYGANIKFEDRWTRAVLKTPVRNWQWDTMQAAHVLDNRPGINSVKFQSFIRFGVDLYNAQIEPYLEADGGCNRPNRIHEIPIDDLLKYNGLDSLYEYHIAVQQRKELKYDC